MTSLASRKLLAPQADGAAHIEPKLADVPALVAANRAAASNRRCECQGFSLVDLAFQARGDLFHAALAYSAEYRDCGFAPALTRQRPFILAGHQPELFHAGVWFKNFLLSSVAAREQAIAINLMVDTDLVRSAAIAVPKRSGERVTVENTSYDAPAEPMPYEERSVLDRECLLTFADRVRLQLDRAAEVNSRRQPLLVSAVWKALRLAESRRLPRAELGRVIAEARHATEAAAGLQTLELPLSRASQAQSFRWFAVHLLAQLPRLWRIYNETLHEYRALHHIRSTAHPVPSLVERDEWREAPLHLWSRDNPIRRRPFVRMTRTGLELTDFASIRLSLDVSADESAEFAVEQLATAEQAGIKLRPRALITTMYARLVLSDLFIHGIGGAKYDELTDEIIRRFFDIEPPRYLTATATFRLPIDRPSVTIEDVRNSARTIRDVRFRPETLIGHPLAAADATLVRELQALAALKREYVRAHTLRRGSRDVFTGLDRLNDSMYDKLQPLAAHLRAEHARLVEQLQQARSLGSREFSFVLYPEEYLVPRLLALASGEK